MKEKQRIWRGLRWRAMDQSTGAFAAAFVKGPLADSPA
jgi:hypothetical protein